MATEPKSAVDELKRYAEIGGLASTSEVCQVTGYSHSYINQLCQRGALSAVKGTKRSSRWKIQRRSVYEFCKAALVESGT
jgi:hypothetical protein